MKHLLSPLLVVFAFALNPPMPALAARTVAITPADITEIKSLEEIIVSGKRDSLSGARKAIEEAEERFYARYNELNTDDDFDITCRMETPTGSHLSFRVCKPRYVDEGLRVEAMRLMSTTAGNVALTSPAAVWSARIADMKKKRLELVRKDPELLRALFERARMQQYYDELRKEKFKGRWIVWD